MAIVTASLPEANVKAKVVAFVPDTAEDEILIGYDFLAKVGARLTIGEAAYLLDLPRGHRRNARDDWRDVGDWVIPRHRPVTPWE